MRVCTRCNCEKLDEDFPSSSKGSYFCKKCNSEIMILHRKTKLGLLAQIYQDQRKNSKNRFMPAPSYTLKEFREYALKDEVFNSLYTIWQENNFISGLNPSCDRLNDYLPYSFDNIQFITWKENNSKNHKDIKTRKYIKITSKPVAQLDLDGNFIKDWITCKSISDNLFKAHITESLKDINVATKGFKWQYLSIYIQGLLQEIESKTYESNPTHFSQIKYDEDTCLVSIDKGTL